MNKRIRKKKPFGLLKSTILYNLIDRSAQDWQKTTGKNPTMKIDSRVNGIFGVVTSTAIAVLCLFHEASATDYKIIKNISVGENVGSTVIWQVTASQEEASKTYPHLPVKICFSNVSIPVQQCEFAGGVEIIGDLEVIHFQDKEEPFNGVLLKTNTYGIGGGPTFLSLWVYDGAKRRFRNILPAKMRVPALGEHKFFPSFHGKIVLITAYPTRLIDFEAAIDDPDRETILSPHRYIVDIYRYVSNRGFSKTTSFKTARKFDPEVDIKTLIDSEMKTIKRLLRDK